MHTLSTVRPCAFTWMLWCKTSQHEGIEHMAGPAAPTKAWTGHTSKQPAWDLRTRRDRKIHSQTARGGPQAPVCAETGALASSQPPSPLGYPLCRRFFVSFFRCTMDVCCLLACEWLLESQDVWKERDFRSLRFSYVHVIVLYSFENECTCFRACS